MLLIAYLLDVLSSILFTLRLYICLLAIIFAIYALSALLFAFSANLVSFDVKRASRSQLTTATATLITSNDNVKRKKNWNPKRRRSEKRKREEEKNALANSRNLPRQIKENNLETLRQFLGLTFNPEEVCFISWDEDKHQPPILDALFIAIDLEFGEHKDPEMCHRMREVGFSILDTRDLKDQNHDLTNLITTHNYRDVELIKDDPKEFIVGESIDLPHGELVRILKRLLYLEDTSSGEIRNLVLVGHGFGADMRTMRRQGILLEDAPSIIEIFDTQFLGNEVFGKEFKSSVGRVVKELGLLGISYHNAGNDAFFTLRSMLLLAIQNQVDRARKKRVDMYRNLAEGYVDKNGVQKTLRNKHQKW